MRAAIALILLSLSVNGAVNNRIVALVNENIVTFQELESQLTSVNTLEEKLEIIDSKIEVILQIEKSNQLGLIPSQKDIIEVLSQIAKDNNITMEELKSYSYYSKIYSEIYSRLAIHNLRQYVINNFNYEITENEIIINCYIVESVKTKQIRIAQIVISEILDSNSSKSEQKNAVIKFLEKLSKHISKGASFEAFAKLHSQHPSYYNGGLSEWLFVNTPNIEIFDSLEDGEVSKIYETDGAWAIAMKVDERYINPVMESCKQQIKNQESQTYYLQWLKELRDSAYIEIYTDKL